MVGLAIILLVPLLITLLIPLFQRMGDSSGSSVGSKRTKAVELTYESTHYGDYYYLSPGDDVREVWFKFKPTKDGDYRFEVDGIENDRQYVIALYKNKEEINVFDTEDVESVNLEKGKKYYFVVRFVGEYVDFNFNASVQPPIPMGADRDHAYEIYAGYNESKEYASLAARYEYEESESKYGDGVAMEKDYNDYKYHSVWFKFVPTVDGEFTFKPEVNQIVYVRLYQGDDDYTISSTSINSGSKGLTYKHFTAGETYYYELNFEGTERELSFAINMNGEPKGMSKNSAYTLTLGTNSKPASGYESLADGNDSQYVWFKFVPSATGKYTFANSSGSGISLQYVYLIEQDKESTVSKQNNTYYNLEAGKAYYLQYRSSYKTSFDVEIKNYAGSAYGNAIALQLDGSTSESSIQYTHNVYAGEVFYKFTPTTSGWYKLTINGYNTGASMYMYDEIPDSDTDPVATAIQKSTISADMTANTTYYVRVYNVSSSVSYGSAWVNSVVPGEDMSSAIALNLGANAAQEHTTVDDLGYVWFSFTPSETAYYDIASLDITSEYSLYVYDSSSSRVYTTSIFGTDLYYMSYGYTYYIQVYASDIEFGMDIAAVNGKATASAINLSGRVGSSTSISYNTSVNNTSSVWFKFTPDYSGYYKFTLSNVYSSYYYYLNLYTESDTTSYVTRSYCEPIAYNLTAGTTYYIQLYYTGSIDSSFTMAVSTTYAGSTRNTAFEVTSGNNGTVSYDSYANDGVVWFKFTPTHSAYYTIYTDNDSNYKSNAYIYQGESISASSSAATSSSAIYSSRGLQSYMSYGYTYYIKLTPYNYTDSYFALTIN